MGKILGMGKIWQAIKREVEQQNWDTDGLRELFDKKLDVILTRYPIAFTSDRPYSVIERNGDIVVGFYLDGDARAPVSLQLTLGGVSLPDLQVQPGAFAYTFDDTHVYPIISVVYSELHVAVQDCTGLYVVYALIRDDHMRRALATQPQVMKLRSGKIAICRGGFGFIEKLPDTYCELPDMRSA